MKKEDNDNDLVSSIVKGGLILGIGALAGLGGAMLYESSKNEKIEEEKEKKMLEEAKNDPEMNKDVSELPDYSSVNSFLCPITKNIMKNPVITPYGTTYDKDAILGWLKTNETCPLTKKPLNRKMLIPNYALKNAITRYVESSKIINVY